MEISKYRLKQALERQKELIEKETGAEKYFKRYLTEFNYSSQVIIFTSSYQYFIVDFYIPKYKLVIEIDGPSHDTKKSYDANRTKQLKKAGIRKVLRFSNDDVYVLEETMIKQIIKINTII